MEPEREGGVIAPGECIYNVTLKSTCVDITELYDYYIPIIEARQLVIHYVVSGDEIQFIGFVDEPETIEYFDNGYFESAQQYA